VEGVVAGLVAAEGDRCVVRQSPAETAKSPESPAARCTVSAPGISSTQNWTYEKLPHGDD
jgi:hypothetical protein